MRTRNRVGTALALMVAVTAFTVAGCSDDGASDASPDNPADVIDDGVTASADDEGDSSDQSDDLFGAVEVPDDIPLPEGHEVVMAIGNPEAGYTITINSPMSIGEVADFYESELPAAGWESVDREDATGADVISINAERTNDYGMLVQISASDGGGDGSAIVILTGPPGG
ncbi:MAG: hypothetical protein ABI239_05885 [Aquihabitans sp.]